jgi:hypothetical protein
MRRLCLLALLEVLASASVAVAGDRPADRRLVMQLDDQGLVASLELAVYGAEGQLLWTLQGGQADGDISAAQGEQLAALLVGKAGEGVRWSLGGKPLTLKSAQVRLQPRDPESTRTGAVGLLQFAAEPVIAGASVPLEIALTPGAGEIEVLVQTMGRWRVVSTSEGELSRDRRGLVTSIKVSPERPLRVQVLRVP